jgi:hypothetical protein
MQGQVIKMEDFNETRFEFEESMDNESSYQSRKDRFDKGPRKKKRWVLPLTFLFILVAVLSVFWYLGGLSELTGVLFAPGKQTVMIRLPEALFTNSNVEEAMAAVAEEAGTAEGAKDEDGTLTYTLSVEARDNLLEKVKSNLEEKITALEDERQHPYLADISHDNAYRDFYLVIDREQEQYELVLVTVSELFMLVAFYQQIGAGADPAPEVKITLEDTGSGDVLEQLTYPNDLAWVAEILLTAKASAVAPAAPQAGDQVIVITGSDNLNLRNGPEITYLIIDILRSGTILEVNGTEGAWLKVITPEGKEGWVHGGFVEILN